MVGSEKGQKRADVIQAWSLSQMQFEKLRIITDLAKHFETKVKTNSEIKPLLKDEGTKQTAMSLRNSTVFDNKCKGDSNLLLIY